LAVLVRHDPGCRYARIEDGGGHTDAAKRLFDGFNLHRVATAHLALSDLRRGWVAVSLEDGAVGDDVYDSRGSAVSAMFPHEGDYFYLKMNDRIPSICTAASLLRSHRIMSRVQETDRDQPHGGRTVIPALTLEGRERQIEAVKSGRGMLAFGYAKE